MDLEFSPATKSLVSKTRAFVRETVLPDEAERGGVAPLDPEWRLGLQKAARAAGVFGPHLAPEYGGHGLGMVERAPVFEEAGVSLFGPLALNCAAPDEGNQHLLAHVANDDQKANYLAPLARGDIRSAFAMTEPAPGAGSDPRALATAATKVAGGWRIDGAKRFTTGADGAAFSIVMARTSGQPGSAGGATMFLVDADNPGMILERHVPTMDKSMVGGHCEVRFEGCVVPGSAVLGAVNEGFRYAAVRLGPARMTHCMRWLGSARRAHELALERVLERRAFGQDLSELGMIQQMIADSEIDLAASRGLIARACWELDQGDGAADSTSIAKTFVSEAVGRIVDRSVQIYGGLGVSEDAPLARIYREVRPFRIYDGPSEVHRWALSKRAVRRARDSREAREAQSSSTPAPTSLDLSSLRAYLDTNGVAVAGDLRATPITGGFSNLTYRIEDDRTAWVLRRPPTAGLSPSAHDVGREYRITDALQGSGVPVATTVINCTEPTVIGAPFTMVGFVRGRALRTQQDLASTSDAGLAAIHKELVRVLVSLHQQPYRELGLVKFGRPEGFVDRQIQRWRRQWDHVATRELNDVDHLYKALVDAAPTQRETSIVHGDYRIDNTLLDPVEPVVVALIDWEMSTLGDPLTDIAMMCAYQHELFDHVIGEPAASTSGRWPGIDTLAHDYAVLSGADLSEFPQYLALAYFKLAVIAEGIASRRLAGAADGPGFDTAHLAVPGLVAAGLAVLPPR